METAIRGRVVRFFGTTPGAIVATSEARFPKTTSGKIQRGELRSMILEARADGDQGNAPAAQPSAPTPQHAAELVTDVVACIAGVVVVGVMIACMALARQQIPPTVGLATVNPLVTDAMRGTGLKVAPEGGLLAWPRGRASAASVSSFGYSGTNVHLIVRKADPASSPEPRRTDGRGALFVSARSKSALRALLVRYMRFFETTEAPFPLICRTAHAHAHACCHRRVVRVGCACAHRGDPCPRLRQRPDHPPPGCRVRAACSERCH